MGNNQTGSGFLQPDVPAIHINSDLAQAEHGFPSESQGSGAAQLGNWFWGNQYMMGLLEEDLWQFQPGWS